MFLKNCKYWLDQNCMYKDPAYCNHTHGSSDPYLQNSRCKRSRY